MDAVSNKAADLKRQIVKGYGYINVVGEMKNPAFCKAAGELENELRFTKMYMF